MMVRKLAFAFLLISSPVFAHDIYNGLIGKFPGGGSISCCNDKDCSPVHYKIVSRGAIFETRYGPVFVEDWRIQYKLLPGDTSEDKAHWCGVKSTVDDTIITFCAIVPPGSM